MALPPLHGAARAHLERPRIVSITKRVQETARHATIAFEDLALHGAPAGAFAMVWVPGVDEVPMGLGYNDGEATTLTIEGKGECTQALLALRVGDRIGVRGPYGTGFALPAGHIVFVGGGTGIAPMARGAQAAAQAGRKVTVISGARSKDLLLLRRHLAASAAAGHITDLPCTDDGSLGFHGFTTTRLEDLLKTTRVDAIAACGPEAMMVKAVDIARGAGIAVEASLERYMKCATGICDACTVGPGLRLCVEGPVLDGTALSTVPEFGVGHRDAAGILHPW